MDSKFILPQPSKIKLKGAAQIKLLSESVLHFRFNLDKTFIKQDEELFVN